MKKRTRLEGKKIHMYKHCCKKYSQAELKELANTMFSTKKYTVKQYTLEQVSQIITFIINNSMYITPEGLTATVVDQLFYTGYFKLKWCLVYDRSKKYVEILPEVTYNSSIFSLYQDYLHFGLFGTTTNSIVIQDYSIYDIASLLKSEFAGSFFSTLPLDVVSPIRLSLKNYNLTNLADINLDKTKVFSPKDIVQILKSLEHDLASTVMSKKTMVTCWQCKDSQELYRAGVDYAKQVWTFAADVNNKIINSYKIASKSNQQPTYVQDEHTRCAGLLTGELIFLAVKSDHGEVKLVKETTKISPELLTKANKLITILPDNLFEKVLPYEKYLAYSRLYYFIKYYLKAISDK